MKKKGLIWLRVFFAFSAISTLLIVTYIILSPLDNKYEFILGLLSVVVTLILGVSTYYQTHEQTQIDMIDKTPYFRIVKDTEFEYHSSTADIDANIAYQYNKFLQYGNYDNGVGAVVKLEFENVSDCIIKRVKKYVCADKKYSNGGKFLRYNDTELVKMCREPSCKAYEYHNNFNLNENEFDLVSNDKFEVSVIIADGIELSSEANSMSEYDFSVALEIETVHGYKYTQYMEFSVKPVLVFTAADWVMITDYDVEIVSKGISRKYCK